MTATRKDVVDKVKETKDLCNVPSIASDLKLSVNKVKRFFPLDNVDAITTGECDGNFVVFLRRPKSTEDQKQLIPSSVSIWSSHGYQKLPEDQLSVAERNSRYLSLLEDRPIPLISSETPQRELLHSSAVCDLKTEKKTSSTGFFGNKAVTTNGTALKKSPTKREPPTLFHKKTKTEDLKRTKSDIKVEQGVVKKETPSPEKRKALEPEAKSGGKTDTNNVKKGSVGTKHSDSLKSEPAKSTKSPRAESTKATKAPKDESANKTRSPTEKSAKADELSDVGTVKTASKAKKGAPAEGSTPKSSTEAKRKRIDDTSDDEGITKSSRGKAKKLKRVAILDSDSDGNGEDENEANVEATENVEEDGMDTSENPIRETKKSKNKTEKPSRERKTNGIPQKKNSQRASPLKAFATKESKTNTVSDSEEISNAQNDKPNGQRQKRRRRVLKEVSHTFTTEDGFLETKTVKEMVSETDSESEEGTALKNKATAKCVSVASTPAPRGQASLLSFFRKK